MNRRMIFASLAIAVIAALLLSPAAVMAQDEYYPLSEDAVRIATLGVWPNFPTLSDISAAESDAIARAPKCSITEYPFKMQTPWSEDPMEANKMFMVMTCPGNARPRLMMLTYDFSNSAFRFDGVMIPGIARDNPNDTATYLDIVDLIYLRAGWMNDPAGVDTSGGDTGNTDNSGGDTGNPVVEPTPEPDSCASIIIPLAGTLLLLWWSRRKLT
jgi:hypothetical protein